MVNVELGLHFFLDCIKVQGIDHSSSNMDRVFITAPKSFFSDYRFFVNNWSFALGPFSNSPIGYDWAQHTSIPNGFNYVGIPKQSSRNAFMDGDQYNWEYSDFTNLSGLDGQGINQFPESIFDNHQLTNISGNLLDPSYGLEYSSVQELEDNGIAAYGIYKVVVVNEALFDFNQDGIPEDFNGNNQVDKSLPIFMFFVNTNKKITNLKALKFNG